MRIRIADELLPLNLLVVVLILAIILFPSNILRIIMGLPFIFFFPGYTLVAALFPRREGVGGAQRIALGFGLSIAVIAVIGLILNYIPWGIKLESVLWTAGSFTVITSVIAWLRRKRLPESDRFGIEVTMMLFGRGKGIQGRVLSVILVLAVLGALGMMVYAITAPKAGQKFTEFYILGSEGMITDYSKELEVGEESVIPIGIVNREYETASYQVEVRINGTKNSEVGPVVLEHGEEWIQEVSFTPVIAGERQRVEILLYKNGELEPYLEALHLLVNVN